MNCHRIKQLFKNSKNDKNKLIWYSTVILGKTKMSFLSGAEYISYIPGI